MYHHRSTNGTKCKNTYKLQQVSEWRLGDVVIDRPSQLTNPLNFISFNVNLHLIETVDKAKDSPLIVTPISL